MKNSKNGSHFVNMHHTENFQITDSPKVWISGFLSVDGNGILTLATMTKSKKGTHFVNILHHIENFQITDSPKCQWKQNISVGHYEKIRKWLPFNRYAGLPHESPMCSFTLPGTFLLFFNCY